MPKPVAVEVFTQDLLTRKEHLFDFTELEVTRSWHAMDAATFKLPFQHRAVPYLSTGTPIRVTYRGDVFFSGRIEKVTTPLWVGSSTTEVTYMALSWWQLLDYTLGFPVPGNALSAQDTLWWTQAGKSETVVKNYVGLNVGTRSGWPLHVTPDQARGSDTIIQSRMQPLSERAGATMDASGLVFTMEHRDGFPQPLVFDARWGTVHSLELNRMNVVSGGEYTFAAPTATEVIAGGRGLGVGRYYVNSVDPDDDPIWKREGYVDAKDIKVDPDADPPVDEAWANYYTEMKAYDAVMEHQPKTSLSVELRDWESWSYGDPYEVGDRVTVNVNGLIVTDRIESAKLNVDPANGVQINSTIGGWEEDATYTITAAIRSTQAELRRLGSRD